MNVKIRYYAVASLAVVALGVAAIERPAGAQKPAGGVPIFQVDSSWPKFDGNWIFGSIGGVFVDPTNDHVWVLNRPRTLEPDENYAAQNPPAADCCVPPPFVMEFDQNGKFLKGWGGPGAGYEWPQNEHGLSIDSKGNFWIGGNGKGDAQVLKFNREGKFLLQIGHFGKSNGSNDTGELRLAYQGDVLREDERGVRVGRLHQPTRRGLRCRYRKVQAPLGRVREKTR